MIGKTYKKTSFLVAEMYLHWISSDINSTLAMRTLLNRALFGFLRANSSYKTIFILIILYNIILYYLFTYHRDKCIQTYIVWLIFSCRPILWAYNASAKQICHICVARFYISSIVVIVGGKVNSLLLRERSGDVWVVFEWLNASVHRPSISFCGWSV